LARQRAVNNNAEHVLPHGVGVASLTPRSFRNATAGARLALPPFCACEQSNGMASRNAATRGVASSTR